MTIETTVVNKTAAIKVFPLMKKACGTGCVVLFENGNTGTVIHVGESNYKLGHRSECWVNAITDSIWEDVDEVILKSK